MRTWMVVALLSLAGAAGAQSGGAKEERGSVPPGTSQDRSGPGDGAIKGGSVERRSGPGESPNRKEIDRCNQMTGALREQCLRDLGAAVGGVQPPEPAPGSARRAPPPQDLPGYPAPARP